MVDGVYDRDPHVYADAVRFSEVSFTEVISRELAVMDMTAFAMCKDNNIPILVFSLQPPENIVKAVQGEPVGTLIHED